MKVTEKYVYIYYKIKKIVCMHSNNNNQLVKNIIL